jgi:hypothetical protein
MKGINVQRIRLAQGNALRDRFVQVLPFKAATFILI